MTDLVIIARHGDYDPTDTGGDLTQPGRNQAADLANRLIDKHNLRGKKIMIISSTAGRGVQYARILRSMLNADLEEWDILWSDPSRRAHIGKVIVRLDDVVSDRTWDAVIIVTHHEYMVGLPGAFGKTYLQTEFPYQGEVPKGEALVIDCKEKTIVRL